MFSFRARHLWLALAQNGAEWLKMAQDGAPWLDSFAENDFPELWVLAEKSTFHASCGFLSAPELEHWASDVAINSNLPGKEGIDFSFPTY